MEPTESATSVLRFGIFELDTAAGELRRNGNLVRLPPQPFQVLQLLAHNAGELVDRDRIRREVWGDTAVDFDRSLNVCIAQIRAALSDSADSPRFVQTVPRRGYRFLASVDPAISVPLPPAAEPPPPHSTPGPKPRWALAIPALVILLCAAAIYRVAHPADMGLRLAVLPFSATGLSTSDNVQIEGLFDELLTRLGGIQPDRLRVIGRRSVSRFQNKPESLREIGRLLDVTYAVESTVRLDGARLRVSVRLAQTGTETLLWSGSFTQDADAGAFEEAVVAGVSAAVLNKLFPGTPPLRERDAGCRDGWEAYRTGRLLSNRGTFDSLQKSLTYFEQAGCAASQAALAETLTRLARNGRHPEWWERARVAAHTALKSGGKSTADEASAHRSLANIAFWKDWDWAAAEREFDAALRLAPSDPDSHHDVAWLLMARGRRQEALAALDRSIALDPLSARISMDAGWLLLQARRYSEAAKQARRTLELDPEMSEARACLSRALLYAGDDAAALQAIRPLISQERLQAVAGMPPEQAMRQLFRDSIRAKGTMDPYQRAWRLAWVGERAEALSEVEDAFRTRSLMMPLVAVDPGFANIRTDPRFLSIVRRLGL